MITEDIFIDIISKPKITSSQAIKIRQYIYAEGNSIERQDRYKLYLLSPCWRTTRTRILQLSYNATENRSVCEICNARTVNEVHHLTYDRLGVEEDKDLVGICTECHAGIHSGSISSEGLQKKISLQRSTRTTDLTPFQNQRTAFLSHCKRLKSGSFHVQV